MEGRLESASSETPPLTLFRPACFCPAHREREREGERETERASERDRSFLRMDVRSESIIVFYGGRLTCFPKVEELLVSRGGRDEKIIRNSSLSRAN